MQNSDPSRTSAFPPVPFSSWQAQVEKDLSGRGIQKLHTRTLDGFEIKPLYTAETDPLADLQAHLPGVSPYRRGTVALGHGGARWDMRQSYRHPDPARVAEDIAQDLSRGGCSVWLHMDRATRTGAAVPAGDGLFCPHPAALAAALHPVDLARIPVSIDAGGNALPVAAQLFSLAEARGVALDRLRGALNADPIGALCRDGELPYALEQALSHLSCLAAFCAQRAPQVRAAGVSLTPYHNAGASPAQEIAIALATGLRYLRAMVQAGLSVDDAAGQLLFTVAVGGEFFMEIAKLRALRQCWAGVVAHCGGGERARRMAIQATTSAFTATRRDPYVNMLRVTTEAFAAAVGGIDALSTSGFDGAFGPASTFARRIAGNAQVILNEESHVARVADPAGGAYYVEALTDTLAREGYHRFQQLEARGGSDAAALSGTLAADIAEVAARREDALRKRTRALTGVSEFANPDEAPLSPPALDLAALATRLAVPATPAPPPPIEPSSGPEQVASLITMANLGTSLASMTSTLSGGQEGARARALPLRRQASLFEALRDRSDAHLARTGSRPSAFLCNLGSIPEHKARSGFACGFMHAGGIACVDNDGFATPAQAVEAYRKAGTALVVLCGSDAQYGQWVPEVGPLLRAAGASPLLLAGRPLDQEAAYRDAGVTDFIFMGCDVVAVLEQLLDQLGTA